MKKWICSVCGYSVNSEQPPDVCPVCGADKSLFELVEEASPQSEPEKVASSDSGFTADSQEPSAFKIKILNFIEKMIKDHHLHPISVHVPNGVVPASFIFLFLSFVSGGVSALEKAAFINLIFVLFSMPAVIYTGFVDWKNKYSGAMTSVFKTKMVCAGCLTLCTLISVIWRLFDASAGSSWIYLLLNAIILASAGVAGFMGGKLVFNK